MVYGQVPEVIEGNFDVARCRFELFKRKQKIVASAVQDSIVDGNS